MLSDAIKRPRQQLRLLIKRGLIKHHCHFIGLKDRLIDGVFLPHDEQRDGGDQHQQLLPPRPAKALRENQQQCRRLPDKQQQKQRR